MNKSDADIYSLICFLVLVTGRGENWTEKHPNYLMEKSDLIKVGLEAFAALDFHNQTRAIEYCGKWEVHVPKSWADYYELQAKAASILGGEP